MEEVTRYHGFKVDDYPYEPELLDDLVWYIKGELHMPAYPEDNIIDAAAWRDSAMDHLREHGALGVHGIGGSGKTKIVW